MSHKFDVSQKSKLDNPKRREVLPPELTLRDLGLAAGAVMADIGCGIGYFTFPAASIVGLDGKVYALDISSEMLEEVKATKVLKEIDNLELIKVDEYDLKLANELVSFAFVCNVLHEMEDLDSFLVEIRRILTDQGQLSVIEWEKKISSYGPPIEHRIDQADLVQSLELNGFKIVNRRSFGADYYSITVKR